MCVNLPVLCSCFSSAFVALASVLHCGESLGYTLICLILLGDLGHLDLLSLHIRCLIFPSIFLGHFFCHPPSPFVFPLM